MNFDKKLKVWKKRSGRKPTIGCMYASSPHQEDRYYLHLLLATLPSWTSFEDTRSVNGILYNTYKDACARRGLLDDDFEWDATLLEAAYTASGCQQRQMFIFIIINCVLKDSVTL